MARRLTVRSSCRIDGSSRVSTYHATMAANPELMSHWYSCMCPPPLCVGVFGREKRRSLPTSVESRALPVRQVLASYGARGALVPPTRRWGYILMLELDEMAELQPPYPPMSLGSGLAQKVAVFQR